MPPESPYVECPECRGHGETLAGESCEFCRGSGLMWADEVCPQCNRRLHLEYEMGPLCGRCQEDADYDDEQRQREREAGYRTDAAAASDLESNR